MLSIIAAASENNVIGKDNQLLWHLSDDLKHFKRTTKGHHVISGRKTFESQGNKPLPGRTNVVVTRNIHFKAEGCIVVHSLEEALNVASGDDEPFIIGGEQIYRMALPKVDRIYLTRVHAEFQGDTFFPELESSDWEEISRECYESDERNEYPFSVYTLDRKR